MAQPYQLASDGFWGNAYSGVIRTADGAWCPCEYGNADWQGYMDWFAQSLSNRADPWRSPADGGVAIVLKPGQEAVGSMLDSLPPDPPARSTTSTRSTTSSTSTKN